MLSTDAWRSVLYTPTMITKLGRQYFIADCWHSRIIYGDDLSRPICDWFTLTEDLCGGHSIDGDGEIFLCEARFDGGGVNPIAVWNVPFALDGLNFIDRIGEWFYVSSYGAGENNLVRARNLNDLVDESCEKIYHRLGLKGVPYFMTHFDGRHFITEIDNFSGIVSFRLDGDEIADVKVHHRFQGKSLDSEMRKLSRFAAKPSV